MNRKSAVLLLLVSVACGDPSSPVALADSGKAYWPGATWRTAAPSSAGFDQIRVGRMLEDITGGRYGVIDGVVVARFGHVVIEEYLDDWTRTQPHTMQSVSKSVTSLLYGIVLDSVGPAALLDRQVLDVFRDYTVANVDANKQALTIRDLLTMRTGMDFWEQPYAGSPLQQMNNSTGDWVQFVLDRPMTSAPGGTWAYNSGAAILMCGAIRELTGMPVQTYAHRVLFEKIGVHSDYWISSPFDNLPHCGGGLQLTAMDLARVGYLVLRNGRWGDTQVVNESWLAASTQAYSRGAPVFFSAFNAGYGYFWWLFPVTRGGTDTGIIAGSGSGGQWLFVVPSLDLVVAIIARDGAGLDLLYEGILSSLADR